MPWLSTHTLEAVNVEHIQKLDADKAKVRLRSPASR
jgi:hypothetical protein